MNNNDIIKTRQLDSIVLYTHVYLLLNAKNILI